MKPRCILCKVSTVKLFRIGRKGGKRVQEDSGLFQCTICGNAYRENKPINIIEVE